MASLSAETGRPIGNVLIRTYPQKKAKLDDCVIPELAAWLYMFGQRSEKIMQEAYRYSKGTSDSYLMNLEKAMQCRIDTIQTLINCLCDKFSRFEYEKAFQYICETFQIPYTADLYQWLWESDEFNDGGGI